MNNLLRIIDGTITWPYSLRQLKLDEPSRSFSNAPSGRELAEYGCYVISPTAPPSHDPATEKVVEVNPIETDGAWPQRWEVVEMSDEEQQEYYRMMHPPRWLEFGEVVQADPAINALLAQALQSAPALAMALSVGLGKAADGDDRVFTSAWTAARGLGFISDALVQATQLTATQHDLPPEFVAGLGVMP